MTDKFRVTGVSADDAGKVIIINDPHEAEKYRKGLEELLEHQLKVPWESVEDLRSYKSEIIRRTGLLLETMLHEQYAVLLTAGPEDNATDNMLYGVSKQFFLQQKDIFIVFTPLFDSEQNITVPMRRYGFPCRKEGIDGFYKYAKKRKSPFNKNTVTFSRIELIANAIARLYIIGSDAVVFPGLEVDLERMSKALSAPMVKI